MDLLFTTTPATTTTLAPIVYSSLLDSGLTLPYDNSYGISSVVARDMTLALFFMMSAFTGIPEYPKALFHCDFEDGWCPGFKKDPKSDIEWTLWKGQTPSNLTGPSHDHTRFNEYGSYVYLEASNRRVAETAVFTTPPVLMLEKPYYCLRYWYNMYGKGSGSLWIYWNAAGDANIHTVVDKHAGQQSKRGSDWRESTTTLPATSVRKFYRPVVFEFRAIRGTNYKSDIAVDDIVLVPGKCEKIPLSKTATTITFRHITTTEGPSTTTTESWKEAHPDWARCGQHDYFHLKKQMCCQDNIRQKPTPYHQCCAKRAFHIIHNICCNGNVVWVNTHGCCRGQITYKKKDRGCCNKYSTYDLSKEICVNGKIRKMPKRKPTGRGKREVITRWGFF